jgi:hypothetical protein
MEERLEIPWLSRARRRVTDMNSNRIDLDTSVGSTASINEQGTLSIRGHTDELGNMVGQVTLDARESWILLQWLNTQKDALSQRAAHQDQQSSEEGSRMTQEQAKKLAAMVEQQGEKWLHDNQLQSFLRREIFGGFKQTVSVVPAEDGNGYEVLAKWEYLEEIFSDAQDWEEFVAEIEDRVRAVALDNGDDQDMGESE